MDTLPMDVLNVIFSNVGVDAFRCTMYALSPFDTPVHKVDLNRAAKDGCLGAVRWYMQLGHKPDGNTLPMAGFSGDVELISYLLANGCTMNSGCVASAAASGHVHVLEFYLDNNYVEVRSDNRMYMDDRDVGVIITTAAAGSGQLDVLEWSVAKGIAIDEQDLTAAIASGDLVTVRWLIERGCEWQDHHCIQAARLGFTHILKWSHGRRLHINSASAEQAISHGHVQTMMWLVLNTSNQNTRCLALSLINHDEAEQLKIFIDGGYMKDYSDALYFACATHDSIACVQLLLSYGYRSDDQFIISTAIARGNLAIAKLLHSAGFNYIHSICLASAMWLDEDARREELSWLDHICK